MLPSPLGLLFVPRVHGRPGLALVSNMEMQKWIYALPSRSRQGRLLLSRPIAAPQHAFSVVSNRVPRSKVGSVAMK